MSSPGLAAAQRKVVVTLGTGSAGVRAITLLLVSPWTVELTLGDRYLSGIDTWGIYEYEHMMIRTEQSDVAGSLDLYISCPCLISWRGRHWHAPHDGLS